MGRDRGDDAAYTLHDIGEIKFHVDAAEPQRACAFCIGQKTRRADQRLGRHAARVQAVAAHPVGLDQGYPCLDRGGDIRADQPGRAGTDHDKITIEVPRPVRHRHLHRAGSPVCADAAVPGG